MEQDKLLVDDKKIARYKIDWELIEADYIHGYYSPEHKCVIYPTHEDLSKKYGVKKDQITLKSSIRKWKIMRESFRQRIIEQRRKEFGYEKILRMSVYEGETISRLDKLNRLLDNIIEECETGEREFDAKELVNLAKVQEMNHKLAREIFGEPKDYATIHEEATEEIQSKIKQGDKINASDVADLINSLKERTIEIEVSEVEEIPVMNKANKNE